MLKKLYHELFKPKIRYRQLALLPHPLFPTPREQMLKLCLDFIQANKIPGDYYEFGLYTGGTLIPAYHFAQQNHLDEMRFNGFDSFQGLPPITGVDKEDCEFHKGQYACTLPQLEENLIKNGVDLTKCQFVEGFYNESLKPDVKRHLKCGKAALIWVDCDLYESTVPCLKFMTDLLQDGTVIVFDDWFHFKGNPQRGEQRAFREWLDANPKIKATEFQQTGFNCKSFLLHPVKE